MYSVKFKIKFHEDVVHLDRIRALYELFEIPQIAGEDVRNLYWYKIKHNGVVTFWSASPGLTKAISTWLAEKEDDGLLRIIKPK